MKTVLCFGEALIDFLQINQTEADGLSLPEYRQFPGGAPANVAVAIAKLGGASRFAGQVGQDAFGAFLTQALHRYGVDTQSVLHHPTAQTAMAFVSLDATGERTFSFYRRQTADVVITPDQIQDHWFHNVGCLHLCSNTLTDADITKTTQQMITTGKAMGCLISVDVNLRPSLWPNSHIDRQRVVDVMHQADIIKLSREELEALDTVVPGTLCQQLLDQGVLALLITDGPHPIEVLTRDTAWTQATPQVTAVDTTAAGDAFSGGLLYGLAALADPRVGLADAASLRSMVAFASDCGALTVTRQGAYPALPTHDEVALFQSQR